MKCAICGEEIKPFEDQIHHFTRRKKGEVHANCHTKFHRLINRRIFCPHCQVIVEDEAEHWKKASHTPPYNKYYKARFYEFPPEEAVLEYMQKHK